VLLNARRIDDDADGETAWVLVAIEDVTDRRRVEAERDALIADPGPGRCGLVHRALLSGLAFFV
jgi:hypothetical protein